MHYHQGHTVDEIPFQAIFGVTGSWIGLILCVVVLIATVSPQCLINCEMDTNLRFLAHQCYPPAWSQSYCHCEGILLSLAHCSRHCCLLDHRLPLEERGWS